MSLDWPGIDRRTTLVLEWLTEESATDGDIAMVLMRALTIWIETTIPVEERPRIFRELWESLDLALDQVDLAFADDPLRIPASIRH